MNSPTEERGGAVPVPVVRIDAPEEPPPRPPRGGAGRVVIAVVLLFVLLGGTAGACLLLVDEGEPEPSAESGAANAAAEAVVPEAVVPEPVVPEPVAPEPVTPEPVVPEAVEADPEPRTCPDHSGHRSGTWSASSSRGTWTADFTERPAEAGGVELHGDIRVRGTACGTGGHIVGRILEDCSVQFDPYRTGPCRVRYQASFEGEQLTGTLAATGFGMADQGRWRGRRRSGP